MNMVKETASDQWLQPYGFNSSTDEANYITRATNLYKSSNKVALDFMKAFLKDQYLFVRPITLGLKSETL